MQPLGSRGLSILSWLVAVVAATAVGLFAVALIRSGLSDGTGMTPLARGQVARDLAAARNQPQGLSSGAPAPPTAPDGSEPRTRVLDSRGGSVVARCTGDRAFLVSWSPAQGWSVDDGERGPGRTVEVDFEGEDDAVDDLHSRIRVHCNATGRPVGQAVTTGRDHGGDRRGHGRDD